MSSDFYKQKRKELEESNNIKLYKITGNNGDFFYLKVIEEDNNQYCMPIIPKRYYYYNDIPFVKKKNWLWKDDYGIEFDIDYFIRNYAPIVGLNGASDFWISFMENNLGVEFGKTWIEDLGIKNQSDLIKLWE